MSKILKAELHVHLEGTIRPEIGKNLAQRNHLKFPEHLLDPSQKFYQSHDFLKFLQAYDDIAALIKQPQDYFDITYDYLRQSALSNVIYTEMMYSPEHAEKVSGIPSSEHLIAIHEAIIKAETEFNIIGKIIITGVRHFGIDSCERVAKEACYSDLKSVVGFGLGGDEIHYPPQDFAYAYEIAKEGGLKTTIHAGEFGSADSIATAITTCKVDRIGHGVAAIQSETIISILKDLNIPLELCPSSNIKLGLFPEIQQHPIKKFLDLGIQISINSDDPPFMDTQIGQEYDLVQNTFQLSDTQMTEITKMAIDHAFADPETKSKLMARLD